MYKSSISKKQERAVIAGWLGLWAVVAFVAIFMVTQVVLSEWEKAMGQETLSVKPNISVGAGLQISVNAQASHPSVEQYISYVKGEICPLLDNVSKANVTEEECQGF